MLLSRETFELRVAQQLQLPGFLAGVPEAQRDVRPARAVTVDDDASARLELRQYQRMRLERLGTEPGQFHSRFYSPLARQAPFQLTVAGAR